MAKQKPIRKFVSRNLSESIERSVQDAVDSGIDISELVEQVNRGKSIPGQSLTNNPSTPYPWEQPAKYSNPRDALMSITADLLEKDTAYNVIKSLAEGMAATDITTTILFAKFFNGEINPDTMLLLIEPILYTVMSLGSEAGVEYNIEPNDIDEEDEEDVQENIRQFRNVINKVKDKQIDNTNNKPNIREDVLPPSLLEKVKETGAQMKGLLSRQQEV